MTPTDLLAHLRREHHRLALAADADALAGFVTPPADAGLADLFLLQDAGELVVLIDDAGECDRVMLTTPPMPEAEPVELVTVDLVRCPSCRSAEVARPRSHRIEDGGVLIARRVDASCKTCGCEFTIEEC